MLQVQYENKLANKVGPKMERIDSALSNPLLEAPFSMQILQQLRYFHVSKTCSAIGSRTGVGPKTQQEPK